MSDRSFYSDSIHNFLSTPTIQIIGQLASSQAQDLVADQRHAWQQQIRILRDQLSEFLSGQIYFEFAIPRMGRRSDVVLFIEGKVFVIEFKIGATGFSSEDRRQVESYALDLKNFHSGSHAIQIFPILVATGSQPKLMSIASGSFDVFEPVLSNGTNLRLIIESALSIGKTEHWNATDWVSTPYKPTPTIVEAAQALYAQHKVSDIARSDAGAVNLTRTTKRLFEIAGHSETARRKSICFVTGVPGAGKTLVGLAIATNDQMQQPAVFLSGNGPLVDVLREALIRDDLARNPKQTRVGASSKVKQFIQNVHNFRDSALVETNPPYERIVVFDEAQRAWDLPHTSKFMSRKRGRPNFAQSEPALLIDYVNRHDDWCVIVALIGGGQEINSGEIGLTGWRDAIREQHQDWDIYVSDRLADPEYASGEVDFESLSNQVVQFEPDLHLSTSMRSFRAESMSGFVHYLLEGDSETAAIRLAQIRETYPVRVTRDLAEAKKWLSKQARGKETKGIVASSGGIRLKPSGIFVKSDHTPTNWFLNPPSDVRSCHFLEEVATEFEIQGLEVDWSLVAWDADYRFISGHFQHWDFRGTKWQMRKAIAEKKYLQNAYRVLLTRARQGVVIFVPNGNPEDPTRPREFYDGTYEYLLTCGVEPLESDALDANEIRIPHLEKAGWDQSVLLQV